MDRDGCALGEEELAVRLREWGAVLGADVISLGRPFTARKTISIPKAEGRMQEVRRLIDLERQCCPHLEIRAVEDDQRIVLTVEG